MCVYVLCAMRRGCFVLCSLVNTFCRESVDVLAPVFFFFFLPFQVLLMFQVAGCRVCVKAGRCCVKKRLSTTHQPAGAHVSIAAWVKAEILKVNAGRGRGG